MEVVGENRNMMVPWYLMAAYAYYHLNESLIADPTFDEMCFMLDREWSGIEHTHKAKIVRAELQAGTCLLPREQIPTLAKSAACALLEVPFPRIDIPELGFSRKLRDLEFQVEALKGALDAY